MSEKGVDGKGDTTTSSKIMSQIRFTLSLDYSRQTCSCVERQVLFGEDRQTSRPKVLN